VVGLDSLDEIQNPVMDDNVPLLHPGFHGTGYPKASKQMVEPMWKRSRGKTM
jgi:hypothetical protein